MKTQISAPDTDSATVEYSDDYGGRVRVEVFTHRNRQPGREYPVLFRDWNNPAGLAQPSTVCERLYTHGHPLRVLGDQPLVDVIRREWRRRRDSERRDAE